jgi:GNAT superfamily N-acetyltransferase
LNVETRDCFLRHGEELIRARYGPEVADHGFEWPQIGVTPEGFRDNEVIVSHVDGVVAGRAILDAAFYPLAELENLEVSPPFRGRGVGSAIVGHAIETASRAGFLAIHAQTDNDNVRARRLYALHGFVPATRGKMLRVWKFLNLPVLPQFLHDHPMALLESRQAADREHTLRWYDTGGEDELAVTIRGGSCQSDSNSTGPAVSALRLRSGSVKRSCQLDGDQPIHVGGSSSIHVALANEGSNELAGGFRIGLNPGFRVASDYPGGERFSIAAGEVVERAVPVTLGTDFPLATLGICSYPSVPITVDFLLGDHTFWLAAQAHVSQTNGG